MKSVRVSMFDGSFYPGEPEVLKEYIVEHLAEREVREKPLGVIVPHAGYIYSGDIACSAYSQLMNCKEAERAVIIGPSHRFYFEGAALPCAEAFSTPLGLMEVDKELLDLLKDTKDVIYSDEAHSVEHSLEVQLPFLQMIHPHLKILPVVAGALGAAAVGRIVDKCAEFENTLFIISSDLSHYHPYDEAVIRDKKTIKQILQKKSNIDGDSACGCSAINGFFLSELASDCSVKLLDYRNSGDTAGTKDSVVGYCAMEILRNE